MLALGVFLDDSSGEVSEVLANPNKQRLNGLSLIIVETRSDANILLRSHKLGLNVTKATVQRLQCCGQLQLRDVKKKTKNELWRTIERTLLAILGGTLLTAIPKMDWPAKAGGRVVEGR